LRLLFCRYDHICKGDDYFFSVSPRCSGPIQYLFRSQKDCMGTLGSFLQAQRGGRLPFYCFISDLRQLDQDKAVQLFHAFAPMLCKRPTKKIEETVREMSGSEFFIEEKLDGERMQLHKRGNEYLYFSRSVIFHFQVIALNQFQERKGLHISVWETRWYRELDSVHRQGL